MKSGMRNAGLALAALGAFSFSACEKQQQDTGGSGSPTAQRVESAQKQSEQAFDQAKEAQKQASSEQKEAQKAQQEQSKAQKKAAEAEAKATQESQQAQQAQSRAQQETQQAQSEASSAQQQAMQAQSQQGQEARSQAEQQSKQARQQAEQEGQQEMQQQAQQDQHRQQQQAQAAPPVEGNVQTVTGTVVSATSDQVVVRAPGQPQIMLRVTENTQVTRDGQAASINELTEGSEVRASFQESGGQKTAHQIEATSGGQ
jgi:colicin import membrane protein